MFPPFKSILTLFACLGCSAPAATVVFQFGGIITSSSFVSPLSWTNAGGVVGQPITITYTFESGTADSVPLTTLGTYLNAVSLASLDFNGYQSTFVPTTSEFDVYDNPPATTYDAYVLRVNGVPGAAFFEIRLQDGTASEFSSDALPTNLNLANFLTNKQGQLDGPGGAFSATMRFNITSFNVIPEPATVPLSIAGALLLLRRARGKTRPIC